MTPGRFPFGTRSSPPPRNVLDPKDGTVVIDYFTEFAITPATEVNFDLANTSPASWMRSSRM